MAAKLKTISEKGRGEIYELDAARVSIGRDRANEIVLNDASVSRRHCVIEQRGERFAGGGLRGFGRRLRGLRCGGNACH